MDLSTMDPPPITSHPDPFITKDLETFKNKLATLKENDTILSIKDLAKELFDLGLEEAVLKLGIRDDPSDKKRSEATQILKVYLMLVDEECRRVVALRSRGWHDNKKEGDEHFRQQRNRADSTTIEEERTFYKMMIQIGDEMHKSHRIFTIPFVPDGQVNILDLCMAPGGYTAAALDHHNSFQAYGITLATEAGGHTVIIDKSRLQGLRFCDITMFQEFCPSDKHIPEDVKSNFNKVSPFKYIKYHLTFADGKTLRTHDRLKDSYDASLNKETIRLQTAQLILAMNRMHNGGTFVMLLHKIDTWHSANLLWTFSKFAKVEVFKPCRKHASRSSFYLVAKEVDVMSAEMRRAVEEWKRDWYRATFEGPEGTGLPKEEPTNEEVQALLTEFGPRLRELGHKAWMIQADALSCTSYAGEKENGGIHGKSDGAEVKLGLGKRIWHGFKSVLLRDHHEGLRMQRGVGYATFGGRGAGAWPWMAEGGGERIGNDGGRTVGRMRKDDKRAIFMMGA